MEGTITATYGDCLKHLVIKTDEGISGAFKQDSGKDALVEMFIAKNAHKARVETVAFTFGKTPEQVDRDLMEEVRRG
ncbi:hypothetical protein [Adlercreutzia caecimuris]|uniref:hypothetical protein n=1 Tax=Adlercreutzia caecimuris TaxID=671266 RepID=UPI00272B1A3C|nr:hypothetical protein [Adlercreutzia caecimuris]